MGTVYDEHGKVNSYDGQPARREVVIRFEVAAANFERVKAGAREWAERIASEGGLDLDAAGRAYDLDIWVTADGQPVWGTQFDGDANNEGAAEAGEQPKPEDAAVARLTDIAERHGVSWLLLSETVHDLFSSQASEVNNGGHGSMVRCLVEQLGEAGAEEEIRDLIVDDPTGRRYTEHTTQDGKVCPWAGKPAPDDTDGDSRCPTGCPESSTEEACITCGGALGGDGCDGKCGNCADRTENGAGDDEDDEDDGARYYVTSLDGSLTFAGPFADQAAADEAAKQVERERPGAVTDIRYEIR